MDWARLLNRIFDAVNQALKKGRENEIKKDPIAAFDDRFSGLHNDTEPVSTAGSQSDPASGSSGSRQD